MRDGGERDACDVAAKLRVTAALLDCAGQKELCAAFRRANPQTGFDPDRSYKWIQGRSLPRSPQIYEDRATVCGLDRPGSWVAACTVNDFVTRLCVVCDVERTALRRRAGLGEDMADHGALAAACARAWLDTLAAAEDCLTDGWHEKGEGRRPNSAA